jgi:hypothetical protein
VPRTRAILWFLALLPVTGLGACTTPPAIRVLAVDVVEIGKETSEVAVRLEVANPTGLPIRIDTWQYGVDVRGRRVYSGEWVAAITVPAESRILTAIPAVVPNADSPGPDAAWRIDGSIRYLEPSRFSQLLYDLGLNRPSAGFSGDGTKMGSGGTIPSA